MQKSGVFLFEISLFVLEILTFFYYAKQIGDDVILCATKNGKTLSKRYLWKYQSSVLGTWHHKCASQKKHNDTLNVVTMATVGNSLATGAVLIKTKIPSFVVNQEPSSPHNLLMGVKTIWELCLFQVAPFVSFQGLQMGIFFWTERDWSRKSCYGNTIEGVILFIL